MAVTVVKNPAGHKIIDQAVTAEITDSGGDALVTFPYHGLGTGDVVYIVSDIEDYNGFQTVTVIDANTFKLSEYDGADFVGYEQDLEIQYYQTTAHVWSSIFLPIIYKISNDSWPTNSIDTLRTISSQADDNGYTNLNLSGALKSSFNALEYVKISGASDEDLNGVWQIVEKISTSDITIDMPYNSGNSLTGAAIQYYYNNYQVKVKVYGGLQPTHPWYAKKPLVEVAELSLTPDENNLVMFSVSDYIQGKVAIKNNLLIGSYPLNLDAFTGFQISTGESYDLSDNYSLSTAESDFELDTFEGFAVAGKLPFKNVYSGDYSDYVHTSGSPANWLTAFTRLFAVEDLYFDISFIKSLIGAFTVHIDKYVSDYASASEDIAYTDQGIGVYRIPIEVSSVYDSFCVSVIRDAQGGFTPAVMDDLDTWANFDTGGEDWVLNAGVPEIDFNGLGLSVFSNDWFTAYAFEAGRIYSFDYDLKGSNSASTFHIEIQDSGGTMLIEKVIPCSPESQTGNYSFTAPTGAAQIAIWIDNPASCGGECLARIISFTNETEGDTPEDPIYITEEICIDILQSCAAVESGETPEDDFFRLLETGFFRLLEDGERRLLE